MPKVLHLITKSDDATAKEVIARQRENLLLSVQAVDLKAAPPDYAALIHQVFEAEQVVVW